MPSPVKENTPSQSEDESNGSTLNESANGESQSYQDAGRNRSKNINFNHLDDLFIRPTTRPVVARASH